MSATIHVNRKVVPISFGKKSYGLGENVLKESRLERRTDNRKFQGKHPFCKNCPGCGKGSCPIL